MPCPHKQNLGQQRLIKNNLTRQKVPTERGADPQPQARGPVDNVNTFVKVLQSLQHSQQQMMEEIRQLKADKTKEKGSQQTQIMRQTE